MCYIIEKLKEPNCNYQNIVGLFCKSAKNKNKNTWTEPNLIMPATSSYF